MEKTFEELAREEVVEVMGFNVLTENQALKLMQQVREATKAETITVGKNELGIMADSAFIKAIHALPTDRIKLTENK